MPRRKGPVVLMDVGDNIGGGSPADSTILLAAAQRLGVRGYLQTLCDPEAVGACVAAGVGATRRRCAVGGKTDDLHGGRSTVTGACGRLSDGKFEDPRPTHGGWRFFDGGTTAVLETDRRAHARPDHATGSATPASSRCIRSASRRSG